MGVEGVTCTPGELVGNVFLKEAVGDRFLAVSLFAAIGALVALGQADGPALVFVEWATLVPDGFDIGGSADEAVDDEGEHGPKGAADGFEVAGAGALFRGRGKLSARRGWKP